MSRRLIRLEMPVFPDRRMFRIHDTTVDPDAPGGPLPPVGTLVSVNREQLWVGSLQEHIGVRLTFEEWDTAPPAFGDVWEDEASCARAFDERIHAAVDAAFGGARPGTEPTVHLAFNVPMPDPNEPFARPVKG